MASNSRACRISTTHNHTPALSLVDLQLAVLRQLPTPIFVLTPRRTAIFANNVAQTLLGSRPLSDIYGRFPGDLGLELVAGSTWEIVLDKFEEEYNTFREEGTFKDEEAPVHAISLTVLECGGRRVSALLSGFASDDGVHFVLSIERLRNFKEVRRRDSDPRRERNAPFYPEGVGSSNDENSPPSYVRIRNAVFENCDVPGIIIFSEAETGEHLYLPNNKSQSILGDTTDGNAYCHGAKFCEKLQLWDKHFQRRLLFFEYPGARLMKNRVPFLSYECGFTHAVTGDKLVSAIDGECLYDEHTNEFLGGVIWFRDLRDYSKLLENLMPSLDILEKSGELLPHLLWIHRFIDGELHYQFPDRWCEYTGLGRNSRPKFAIHPQDLPGIMRKWFAHHKLGTEYNHEVRFRRHDGVYRWMLLSVFPIRHGSKDLDMWAATNSDIHDSVMARSKDGRLKEQLLAVLSQTDVVLFIMDKNCKISLIEGGTENGFRSNDLLGRNIFEVTREAKHGESLAFEGHVRDILAGKIEMAYSEDYVGDKTYRTKLVVDVDQNFVDAKGKPAIRGIMGLRTDVTDFKKLEKLEIENMRLAAEEQAAKASNELKSIFLANMSHELRTPTAGVIGMAELLSEDQNLTEDQREYISSIQLSGKALLAIVNDILDFSKIESGRLDIEEVPFQLSSIVSELCKLLSMFAQQKGLQFLNENHIDEKLEVLGDPGRIRQILSNLLTNALKFTKEGWVKICVTGTSRKEESREVLDVKFLIEDTGIGIDKEVLKKLFRPFSQGDSSTARLYGGTGLGLTICRNLANLMSGSISLESDTGRGSTATFTVPLKVSPVSRAAFPGTLQRKHSESRHYSDKGLTAVPSWTKPLPYREMSPELLNQAIGCSDTKPFSQPFIKEENSNADADQTPESLTPEERKKFHVLVVEDNAINQLIACRNIRKLGFPVTAVWNGKEALSYLLEPSPTQPRPDIILMDVQMPVMDGYEATNYLRTKPEYSVNPPVTPPVSPREERKRVDWEEKETEGSSEGDEEGGQESSRGDSEDGERIEMNVEGGNFKGRGKAPLSEIVVVAMTASCIQGDKEKCTNAGMDDYLAKPVDKERLEEMLVKWARKVRC